MAKIRVASLLYDSIVDGPGLRNVLFVQGCSHGCPGCHNPSSWDPLGAEEIDTSEIIDLLLQHPNRKLTLSGGEPFQQAKALVEIVKVLKEHQFDIWSYSGYTWEYLSKADSAQQELLTYLDVLVDGPFILQQRNLNLLYRGSSNQRLIDVQRTLQTNQTVLYNTNPSKPTETIKLYI